MSSPLPVSGVRALLLDVEGTTTPVDFVYGVLFPYARAHVRELLDRHGDDEEVRAELARLGEEHAADVQAGLEPPPWHGEATAEAAHSATVYVLWLMDRDRKSTALKALQGRIWQEGYRSGALQGRVFPDVPPALRRWRRQGKVVAIFSSGSVLAQKLLFGHTSEGDLTGLIDGHFDTTIGSKREAASYGRIAGALGLKPDAVLFLSDVAAELLAAETVGLQTALCMRGHGQAATGFPVVRSFDVVCP